MIDKYGAVSGVRTGRENSRTRKKPIPVPLSEPRMPHELTWDRTQAAGVGSRKRQKESNLKKPAALAMILTKQSTET
jgi:hypothetical protein